jgi:hypothetical protein
MWSCAVNNVVYLSNRTYCRAFGLSGGAQVTMLTSTASDASKFRVFGYTVFAKVPDKVRRKLGKKAFRGVMVGYPPNTLGYRVYNHVIRRMTTPVHIVFLEDTPGFVA